jgi:hypothetical protein
MKIVAWLDKDSGKGRMRALDGTTAIPTADSEVVIALLPKRATLKPDDRFLVDTVARSVQRWNLRTDGVS